MALDGWLSEHRFGQSFRVKPWLEILQKNKPLATEVFQEVLVKNMPPAIAKAEGTRLLTPHSLINMETPTTKNQKDFISKRSNEDTLPVAEPKPTAKTCKAYLSF